LKRSQTYQFIGIDYYSTNTPGIGGRIRQILKDFIVEEIALDKKVSFCFKNIENLKYYKKDPFLRLSLIKYGLDNLNALKNLADELGISASEIGFAGMKDKSAVTSQFISLKNLHLDKIQRINIKCIELRNLHSSKSRIKIGDLFGNHFTITIRNLEGTTIELEKTIKDTLREIEYNGGIMNYFGIQRFGVIRPISHLVGKAILKKHYEKAVKVYLAKVYPIENPEARRARIELNENWDFQKALKQYPKHLIYERFMLKSLIKFPNNYQKALGALPKRLQSMLFFSYQSFLFNKILSRRKEENLDFKDLRINDVVLMFDEFELPTHSFFIASEKNFDHLNDLIKEKRAAIAAPLVGFQTQLKQDYIKNIIEEEGIKLTDFKSIDRQFNRKGSYRTILFSPLNFKIKKITDDELNPHKKKVILDFSLKRGYYASILLEELIKNKKLEK